MKESIVMTIIGRDRPGLVESLSAVIAEHGGNWEESRMVHLAGEFAGLLHVHLPADRAAALERALSDLDGVSVSVQSSEDMPPPQDTRSLEMEVVGHDHPGIVHRLSRAIAAQQINIEELSTELVSAPMSGELLFQATARLQAPIEADVDELKQDLERLAADLMVDISLDEPD